MKGYIAVERTLTWGPCAKYIYSLFCMLYLPIQQHLTYRAEPLTILASRCIFGNSWPIRISLGLILGKCHPFFPHITTQFKSMYQCNLQSLGLTTPKERHTQLERLARTTFPLKQLMEAKKSWACRCLLDPISFFKQ